METIEFVKNNFLGMSHENQKIVLNTLLNTLNENKMEKLLKKFNINFDDYYQRINKLLLFKESYKNFNDDERTLAKYKALKELKQQIDNHDTVDYSEEKLGQQFLYLNRKIEKYISYFWPESVSLEMVHKFLIEYSKLTIDNKCKLIEEMILYYDDLNFSALPAPQNILKEYRPIIQNMIGDKHIGYYDYLFPEEQIRLIMEVIDYFEMFKYDNEYYNKMIMEVRDDSKVRKIKIEAKRPHSQKG